MPTLVHLPPPPTAALPIRSPNLRPSLGMFVPPRIPSPHTGPLVLPCGAIPPGSAVVMSGGSRIGDQKGRAGYQINTSESTFSAPPLSAFASSNIAVRRPSTLTLSAAKSSLGVWTHLVVTGQCLTQNVENKHHLLTSVDSRCTLPSFSLSSRKCGQPFPSKTLPPGCVPPQSSRLMVCLRAA
jgi:hypothetical protein